MPGDVVEAPAAAAARFLQSLRKPSHILVAISGGGDSVGLLVALAQAIRTSGTSHRLSAATIDHCLRPESAGEARAVSALCARFDIAHHVRRWEGEKPGTGLMAAAREARYELLCDIAIANDADLIVTGHTLDDQRETLAMRGARQSGEAPLPLRGIAEAMLFDRRCWVVRPFLRCGRDAIRDFLIARSVTWVEDPSNDNMKYERVRIRAALRQAGAGPAGLVADTISELPDLAAAWVGAHVRIHAGIVCEVDREALAARPEVVHYAMGQLAAAIGGRPFVPGRETLGRIIAFLHRGEPGRRTAAGVVFDLRRDALYLIRENRGVGSLLVPAQGRAVWDGRFDVANRSDLPVRIAAGNVQYARLLPAEMPKGVVQRACLSAPGAAFEGDCPAEANENLVLTARLAPFDRFLTRFDYNFADQLALAFARMPYLSPPL